MNAKKMCGVVVVLVSVSSTVFAQGPAAVPPPVQQAVTITLEKFNEMKAEVAAAEAKTKATETDVTAKTAAVNAATAAVATKKTAIDAIDANAGKLATASSAIGGLQAAKAKVFQELKKADAALYASAPNAPNRKKLEAETQAADKAYLEAGTKLQQAEAALQQTLAALRKSYGAAPTANVSQTIAAMNAKRSTAVNEHQKAVAAATASQNALQAAKATLASLQAQLKQKRDALAGYAPGVSGAASGARSFAGVNASITSAASLQRLLDLQQATLAEERKQTAAAQTAAEEARKQTALLQSIQNTTGTTPAKLDGIHSAVGETTKGIAALQKDMRTGFDATVGAVDRNTAQIVELRKELNAGFETVVKELRSGVESTNAKLDALKTVQVSLCSEDRESLNKLLCIVEEAKKSGSSAAKIEEMVERLLALATKKAADEEAAKKAAEEAAACGDTDYRRPIFSRR